MTAEPGSPRSSGTPASDSQRPQHHIPKHPTGTSHGSAAPNPREQLSQSKGSLRATPIRAPTLGRRHLPLVELLEALLVGLAVVVDLRLRSRVELDVADLAEREGLLLLLPLQALLGLAAGRLHQPQTVLRAVGWAQGSLHACGGEGQSHPSGQMDHKMGQVRWGNPAQVPLLRGAQAAQILSWKKCLHLYKELHWAG